MNPLRVVQVVRYPPPYGGNSVHGYRLLNYCLNAGIDTILVDPYGGPLKPVDSDRVFVLEGNPLQRLVRFYSITRQFEKAIAHFHLSAFGRFVWVGLPMLRAVESLPKVLTIHSGSFVPAYRENDAFKQSLIRSITDRFDIVIVVNSEQAVFVRNTFRLDAHRVKVIPAFLPPVVASDHACEPVLHQLAGLRSRTEKVLLASGFLTSTYAHEVLLDAVSMLRSQGRHFGLILVFYSAYDPVCEEQVMARVLRNPDVLAFRDLAPEIFARLLAEIDIYVRPTRREGDSIALREAGYFGKQTIASAVVPRPRGVMLFETDNVSDLAPQILKCANNPTAGRMLDPLWHGGQEIIEIYMSLAQQS